MFSLITLIVQIFEYLEFLTKALYWYPPSFAGVWEATFSLTLSSTPTQSANMAACQSAFQWNPILQIIPVDEIGFTFSDNVTLYPGSKLTKSITNPYFCAGTAPGWSFPGSWLENMTSLRCSTVVLLTQHHIKKVLYYRRRFSRCFLLRQQIMIHYIVDFFLLFFLTLNQKLLGQ